MWTQWGKERVGRTESSVETYTLPDIKQRASGNLLYEAGSSNPVLCDNLEVGRGGKWEGVPEGGDI